jgi:hypothetical protein
LQATVFCYLFFRPLNFSISPEEYEAQAMKKTKVQTFIEIWHNDLIKDQFLIILTTLKGNHPNTIPANFDLFWVQRFQRRRFKLCDLLSKYA